MNNDDVDVRTSVIESEESGPAMQATVDPARSEGCRRKDYMLHTERSTVRREDDIAGYAGRSDESGM